ncbi:MAG TPA: hypothetical protein VHE30_12580 [Polyangiaceae bacterium]|nr:hypothetical protein [Polyangiaceae bacterium]
MTEQDLGKIKGRAILDFLTWLAQERGPAVMKSIVDGIPLERRGPLSANHPTFGLSSREWYPAEFIHALIEALLRTLDPADARRIAMDGGGAMIRNMMHGPLAIVFALLVSPRSYGTFVSKVWNLSYDSGSLSHRMLDDTSDEVTAVGWRAHHPFLCLVNTGVRIATFEVMGCKNVRLVSHDCTIDGENRCQSVLRWEP